MTPTPPSQGPPGASDAGPSTPPLTTAQATDISIRLWSPEQLADNYAETSWKTPSALVFMICDLVVASGGIPADDPRLGLLARFESVLPAYQAARRIQEAILEFAKCRPARCFGAAIAIHSRAEMRPFGEGDPSRGLISGQTLLASARPAQILISPETALQLQVLPGLNFRPLLPAPDGFEPAGQELVWTSPGTYEHFAGIVQQEGERVTREQQRATRIISLSEGPSVPNPAETPALIGRTPAFPDPTAFLPPPPTLPGPRNQWRDWLSATPIRLSLAGIAALAIVVGIFAFRSRPRPTLNLQPSVKALPSPNMEGPAQPPVSTAPQPGETSAEPSTAITEPSPKAGTQASPETSKERTPPPREAKPRRVPEYEGFTQADIPYLLREADANAGAGHYADAQRRYQIVLHLDPGNVAAREGMRRLSDAR